MQIFRITNNKQFTGEELTEFWNKNQDLKGVREYKTYDPPLGEHIHGWCDSGLSAQAIAIRIKQGLNCKGNADYSIGQKEVKENDGPEGYKRYCCKSFDGENPPTLFWNISAEAVNDFHKLYWEMNNKYIEEKKKRGDSSQKSEIYQYCTKTNTSSDEEELVLLILKYFDEKDKIVSNNQVENYYYYISGKMNPKRLVWRANCIVQKMARN